jgi:hypothetical protein
MKVAGSRPGFLSPRERDHRRKRDRYRELGGGGTHTGPTFEGLQIDPLPVGSRNLIEVAGHSVIKVKESRIAEEWVWSVNRQQQMRETWLKLAL